MSLLSSSYEEYKQKIKVIIKEQLDFVNGECSSPETPENLISGEETSGINSFEKEDLVKEEKSNIVEEISVEPDITAEVENDAEIEAASESDNIVNATDAKSSDTTIEEKQNFIWQSVEEDDDIKDKEIDAENDTVSDIKENEAVENINKSEVLKSEDKKQTGIEENKNEADNAEDDIIVENIMMKTPTINDAKEDISNTVFPASMPKDDSVSYLSGNNAGSKEKKNKFTFIKLYLPGRKKNKMNEDLLVIKKNEVPAIQFNKKELIECVDEILKQHKGILYTIEDIPKAKKVVADLRKQKKYLNSERISACKPYEAIVKQTKADMDYVLARYDTVIQEIDTQIKESENVWKKEREDYIRETYKDVFLHEIPEKYLVCPIIKNLKIDSKWMLKSTSKKKIKDQIIEKRDKILSDINTLKCVAEEEF